MQLNSQKIINEKNILWFIILVGTILRFHQAESIPFTHDELSAIGRLQFNNFSDLIELGVKVDGHPALIQVFLYYWTRLFGISELVIKVPFLIMGIASIPVSYYLTAKWFNTSSALLVASFIATLQFPIMFSQIARPYISGMLFILLLSYFWTEYLFNPKASKWSLLGVLIFASLSTYNHYFSFMLAGIIGLTGFFFLTTKTRKGYISTFLLVAILFIPHLKIFLFQLGVQGLDWLGVPTLMFFVNHIKFIFHYNSLTYLMVIFITIFGISQSKKLFINKFQWISLTWFITPIIIGLTYSILVKPVVQFSMLIFSFPFLLLFLFSWLKPLKSEVTLVITLAVIGLNTYTLINDREHYKVFYNQPIEEFSNLTNDFLEGKFTDSIPEKFDIYYADEPKFLDFYFNSNHSGISYNSYYQKEFDPIEFKAQISNPELNYLILGNLDPTLVLLAQEIFTSHIFEKKGLNHTYIILGKPGFKSSFIEDSKIYESKLDFDNENHEWPIYNRELELNNYILRLDTTEEWGPILNINLNEVTNTRHNIVQVKLDYKSSIPPTGLIVISVNNNETQLSWSAIALDKFYKLEQFNQWQRAFFSIDLANTFTNSDQIDGAVLSISHWNMGLKPIALDNFEVKLIKGNPYIYSTVQPID